MKSISICIFSTKLGEREIEKVVSVADRIIFIGLSGEISRVAGKMGYLPHNSASYKLNLGVSSLDFPSRNIMNSYKFCWMVRALKAERDLALLIHTFHPSDPNIPFASCHALRVPSGKDST